MSNGEGISSPGAFDTPPPASCDHDSTDPSEQLSAVLSPELIGLAMGDKPITRDVASQLANIKGQSNWPDADEWQHDTVVLPRRFDDDAAFWEALMLTSKKGAASLGNFRKKLFDPPKRSEFFPELPCITRLDLIAPGLRKVLRDWYLAIAENPELADQDGLLGYADTSQEFVAAAHLAYRLICNLIARADLPGEELDVDAYLTS